MQNLFLREGDLKGFVEKLMEDRPVIAPVAKSSKFTFSKLETVGDLRLDYDVTILPPKKAIFATRQRLVEFDKDGVKSGIDASPQILFGVHFYDIKAMDQLDQLFTENHHDDNYHAYREVTTLVGSSIQSVSERAFFGSVAQNKKPRGHDAFLTKIKDGYLFETFTKKGGDLVRFGSFEKAKKDQMEEAAEVNQTVLKECPEGLSWSSDEIAKKMRASYGNDKLWNELSKNCFSCGTCNVVCPTCYCFDVQDTWNLDQTSGYRYREWDGCQLRDFAKISLGAGAELNFREEVAHRHRHRMMRKATYLNPTLGSPACVGCGRCSAGCVPDIADPVHIISKVMEA